MPVVPLPLACALACLNVFPGERKTTLKLVNFAIFFPLAGLGTLIGAIVIAFCGYSSAYEKSKEVVLIIYCHFIALFDNPRVL